MLRAPNTNLSGTQSACYGTNMLDCENVYQKLCSAVKHGNTGTLRSLLDAHLLPVGDFSTHSVNLGKELLHTAIKKGYPAIVEELLKRGVDVNGLDFNGSSVLHLAVKNKAWHIAYMLWLAGADPHHLDLKGLSVLSMLPASSALAEKLRGAPPPPLKDVQLALSLFEEERSALGEKFFALVSDSLSGRPTVSAQRAVAALQSVLQLHANRAEGILQVNSEWVVNVVVQHMQQDTGRLSPDGFFKCYHYLKQVSSVQNVTAVSNKLRMRFKAAADGATHLHQSIATALLRNMFEHSGGGSDSWTKGAVSFRRTTQRWNESEVERNMSSRGNDERAIDEDGFMTVGLAILLGA